MVRFFTSFSAQPRLAVVTTTLEAGGLPTYHMSHAWTFWANDSVISQVICAACKHCMCPGQCFWHCALLGGVGTHLAGPSPNNGGMPLRLEHRHHLWGSTVQPGTEQGTMGNLWLKLVAFCLLLTWVVQIASARANRGLCIAESSDYLNQMESKAFQTDWTGQCLLTVTLQPDWNVGSQTRPYTCRHMFRLLTYMKHW